MGALKHHCRFQDIHAKMIKRSTPSDYIAIDSEGKLHPKYSVYENAMDNSFVCSALMFNLNFATDRMVCFSIYKLKAFAFAKPKAQIKLISA